MPNDTRPTCTFFDFPGDDKLFPTPHASDFGDFVRECVDFYHRHPEIERMILEDQRRHALEAKHRRARAANDQWVATLPLKGFEDLDADLGACSVQLGVGRPRTHPLAVFVFLMIRGRNGGPCHQQSWDLVVESRSLEAVLAPCAPKLPARTTILENLNALSDATMEAIHSLQLAEARAGGLDDFEQIAVDSTAVKASSAWPTDSKTIRDLCGRYLRCEKHLLDFGFDPGGKAWCLRWEEQLDRLHKSIGMVGSGTGAPARRKRLYREFYVTGCTLLDALIKRQQRLLYWLAEISMPPLRKERAGELIDAMGADILMACRTLQQSIGRVEEGKMPKTRERVLGVADRAAAIIVKGGREPVMGYKPQLARSVSGFVTALIIESGNGSDSANLLPLVRACVDNTGVVPSRLSADDGYASAQGLAAVQAMGVDEVSISGAKGKVLMGDQWDLPRMQQLRCWRSAVESLMFCLKHGYRFGRMGRRGLEAVRREMTEKVMAYNLDRAILLRKRRSRPESKAA